GIRGFHVTGVQTCALPISELHMNIFLHGDENISEDWNFDWKVVSINETEVEISNGTDRFRLTKECDEPCIKFLFEECEIEPGSRSEERRVGKDWRCRSWTC